MALARRFPVAHEAVFAHGAFLVSVVTPVLDFEASSKDNKVQARCKDTGFPLWSVEALDADPEARKQSRTVSVKFACEHQPVPPANPTKFPFVPVAFEGLTALPYVDDNGSGRARLAWSFRADAMTTPSEASKDSTSSSPSSAGSGASSSTKAAA